MTSKSSSTVSTFAADRAALEECNRISRRVIALTDEHIAGMTRAAQRQVSYKHPSKLRKQAEINDCGRHNLRVVEALENLRDVIAAGAPSK